MRRLEFSEATISVVAEPFSAALNEPEHFTNVRSPGQAELLSREIVDRMGRLVTVSTFRVGDAPHDIFVRTTPMRYPDDMKIITYADRALALVAERRAGRLALDAELNRLHSASAESADHFARRLAGLREAFHKELRVCDARKNGEVVARYMRNCDDLDAAMRLAQARADQYGEALLNGYTELSDADIHDYAAGTYDQPDEAGLYHASAAANHPRRRAWTHQLKRRIEDYSDVVLGTMDAWWWRAGDMVRGLMHIRRA